MDHIERNLQIIRQRMIEQMEKSLKLGRSLIDSELDTGLLNFIVKPLIKAFYDYWSQHDARRGTLKQIEVTLNAGKKIVLKGSTEEVFQDVLNRTFPSYLKEDQTYQQCSKYHKNYKKLENITKKTYSHYLNEVVLLLQVEETARDYGELCSYAFKTRKEATNALLEQLAYTDQAINIVEEDPSILKIAAGKKIILKALRKGFEISKEEFISSIDKTF